MSISSTLSSALSGLTAASRAADVVSSNIANATTDGYSTRRLDLSTRMIGNDGAGVRVNGVVRQTDPVITGQRRVAEANMAAQQSEADFMLRLEQLIGTPDSAGSLSARFAEFEASLVSATNAPWNNSLLSNAVAQAKSVATNLNNVSNAVQDERLNADAAIGRTVDMINGALKSLEDLNVDILSAQASSGDMASLLDAQTRLVDQIAPFIPIQARREETGALRLFSEEGVMLLSSRAATLEFTPSNAMDPFQDYSDGDLSGISINGRDLRMGGASPTFAGGGLQAMFDLRDTWAPEAQGRLDAIAMDLAERFDRAGLDTTIAPGNPGLFTDGPSQVSAANEIGLAARLSVNALVDESLGGDVWRLRDGFGATAEGPSGNSALLSAMVDTLSVAQTTTSAAFSIGSRTMTGILTENLSITGFQRANAETGLTSASARFSALETSELAQGVDTDDELQRLLKIEQMFAANARVITVADEMMTELLRIAA
ncbi:flagellar hook-associated protein FlgK [Gymnodinialimonas sp. 2305UL16-5]|uniref:flagellar hook-associated protein FlgK n=1 Tax=Gymnodinialimonas mytili TaxID=3126503 RepID=UPI00309D9528